MSEQEFKVPQELADQLRAQKIQAVRRERSDGYPEYFPVPPGIHRDIPMTSRTSPEDRVRAILDAQQAIESDGYLIGGTK